MYVGVCSCVDLCMMHRHVMCTHMYMYMYIYECVGVCVCVFEGAHVLV